METELTVYTPQHGGIRGRRHITQQIAVLQKIPAIEHYIRLEIKWMRKVYTRFYSGRLVEIAALEAYIKMR